MGEDGTTAILVLGSLHAVKDLNLRDLGTIHPIPMHRDVGVVEDVVLRLLLFDQLQDFAERPHAHFSPAFGKIDQVVRLSDSGESSEQHDLVLVEEVSQGLDAEVVDAGLGFGRFDQSTEGSSLLTL